MGDLMAVIIGAVLGMAAAIPAIALILWLFISRRGEVEDD